MRRGRGSGAAQARRGCGAGEAQVLRGRGAGAAQCVAGEARREARDWMSFAASWARVGCAQLSTSCAEGLGKTLTIFHHGLASKSSIRGVGKLLTLAFQRRVDGLLKVSRLQMAGA